ncbi:hypothetical protein HUJ04_002693 [Dendroctonus ponderosae]|nr:hypothetical protein HUJ04_002693 [Dendroctonus ponderosae]
MHVHHMNVPDKSEDGDGCPWPATPFSLRPPAALLHPPLTQRTLSAKSDARPSHYKVIKGRHRTCAE